ncbi:MAG TPA: hypothetical protein VN428_24915 [Bryobacteraceae bacterium]|nr:hypothetical protein [Bryobacteraceae bacterium]
MFQRVTSVFVALLVFGTLLWGSCPACALVPSAPVQTSGEHDCCPTPASPDKDHAPQPHNSSEACTGQIVAPDSNVPSHVQGVDALPTPVPAISIAAEAIIPAAVLVDAAPTLNSPPDLYLQNATLLV